MFKSIVLLKYLKKEENFDYFLFKIIDDDFEEECIGTAPFPSFSAPAAIEDASAIINCYSSKNLDVVKNLILFMQFYEKDNYAISKQINAYKIYISDFNKYLPEIEKYINLL